MEIDHKLWAECQACAKNALHPGWPHRYLGMVDGNKVYVSHYDHVFVHHDKDFNQGGNDLEDSGLCNKHELLLDDRIRHDDWPFILYHEALERRNMARGWSYEKAHEESNKHENELRRPRADRPRADGMNAQTEAVG